ncbi:MAG TPA: AI-2E family transporter, partial [Armatimonadota bacterium]
MLLCYTQISRCRVSGSVEQWGCRMANEDGDAGAGLRLDPQWVRFAAFVILLVALTYILFRIAPLIWSVLQIFIFVFLIALTLYPAVRWQIARGVPRWAAVLQLYILLITLIALLFYSLIPTVIAEAQQFIAAVPTFLQDFRTELTALTTRYPQLGSLLRLDQLGPQVLSGIRTWSSLVRTIFETSVGAITAVLLIFVTTLYTLLNPWPMVYGLRGLFPTTWWPVLDRVSRSIALRIQGWVLGTIVLGIIMGVLEFLALTIVNLFFPIKLPFVLFF